MKLRPLGLDSGRTGLIAADTDEAEKQKPHEGLVEPEQDSAFLLLQLFDCKLAASSAVCVQRLRAEVGRISAAAQAWTRR